MLKNISKIDANTSSSNLVQKIDHNSQDSDLGKNKVSFRNLPIKCKLSIGSSVDPLEHEADAMADKVMRMPENGLIQRKCSSCEEEEKLQRKPLASFIQKKGAHGGLVASASVSNRINSSRGKGSGLSGSTKSFMESRFETDFSNVNIHIGGEATQMNRELNAKAFTVGNDIYFNEGQYQPGSNEGKHLLAHELTHAVQQNISVRKKIQRWTISGNTATADNEGDYLGRLAIKAGGNFNDWKCIKPLKMKTSTLKKVPSRFNDHYEEYVQIGDQFDISNIIAAAGGALNIYLFDDAIDKKDADLAKLFYPGSVSSLSVDTDIDSSSNSGMNPIGTMVIFGHSHGDSMWGSASTFIPRQTDPEDPVQSHVLASVGLFPRRCWFAKNAVVRSVGCNSEVFGNDFAKAYLRKGAKIITTTASVRPTCTAANNDQFTNICKLFDGVDFAASPAPSAAILEGPFNSVGAFHGGSFWKEIDGKL